MARIRTLKPECWQDEALGTISRDARLLFVGLITQADDAGRLKAGLSLLKSLIFPYDTGLKLEEIESWLAELTDAGLVIKYERDCNPFVSLKNWAAHQRISHPKPSRNPAPPRRKRSAPPPERSVNVHGRKGSRIKDQGREQGTDQGEQPCEEQQTASLLAKRSKQNATSCEDEARRILEVFNSAAGTKFSSREFVLMIAKRLEEHPELTPEQHADIIRRNLASGWWSGRASPNVIYGSAAQFERAMHQEPSQHPADKRVLELMRRAEAQRAAGL